MSYIVSGLSAEPFRPLFGLPDEDLRVHGARRIIAGGDGFYPCRVSLEDASPGESLLLVNFEHQPAASPYRSRHAIFVSKSAGEAAQFEDRVPAILATRRHIALRAYDETGFMLDAELVPGARSKQASCGCWTIRRSPISTPTIRPAGATPRALTGSRIRPLRGRARVDARSIRASASRRGTAPRGSSARGLAAGARSWPLGPGKTAASTG